MKKYILLGIFAGTALSLLLLYLNRRRGDGMEFDDFIDSPSTVDDLFGNAFQELPDKS
jgi:hypothetical protein